MACVARRWQAVHDDDRELTGPPRCSASHHGGCRCPSSELYSGPKCSFGWWCVDNKSLSDSQNWSASHHCTRQTGSCRCPSAEVLRGYKYIFGCGVSTTGSYFNRQPWQRGWETGRDVATAIATPFAATVTGTPCDHGPGCGSGSDGYHRHLHRLAACPRAHG